MEQALAFLRALWAPAPSDHYCLLWTMPDKRSRWFRTTDDGLASAAETVGRFRDRNDIYMGAGLSSKSHGSRQRVVAADVSGIAALWADVDYQVDGAHKKPNLPPDQDAAMQLLTDALIEPSIIVHSGHGLQAWWLLDKPMMFVDRQQQGAGQQLEKAWNDALRAEARKHKWDVDATWDLARVMRLPGGLNHKTDPPPPVRTLKMDADLRYPIGDLRRLVGAEADQAKALEPRSAVDYGFELRESANPPFQKWEALRQADPGVEKTWRRQKTKMADQSPSAYDLALANYAAMAGWEDQEIVDLLIAHRRHNKDDLKLNRPDYYARTMRKARDGVSRDQATQQADELVEELEYAQTEEERYEVRNELCDWLSNVLKVGVTRVERFESDPPTYRILTENGWAQLGNTQELFSQQRLRAAVVEVSKSMPPRMKAAQFDQVVTVIVQAAVSVDMGPEATTVGSVEVWLQDFLEHNQPTPEADWDDSTIAARAPFIKDGRIHIFLRTLRQFIEQYEGDRLTTRDLADRLKKFGAEPVKVNVTMGGSPTSRSVWRLPPIQGAK